MCSGALIFSYELERVLTFRELLSVMGYPAADLHALSKLSESEQVAAAGGSQLGQCVASILSAIVFNPFADE